MKVSFTTFACPDWSMESILSAAVRHGYHGVEFRCDAGHNHGIEVTTPPSVRRGLRSRLDGAGIEPCCLATGLQFVNDWSLNESRSRMELAADLGCPAIRVFCGKPTDEMSMPDMIEKVGQQLRNAAEIASYTGVQIWIETHDTFSRARDAAAAIRMAEHPDVGIVYDNLHPYRRGEPLTETFAAITGLIRHVHFHDGLNKEDQVVIKPFGQGDLPLVEMIRKLGQQGYDGYVCGEWFHEMYGRDPDDALEAYYLDMTTLAQREGLIVSR